MLAFVGRSSRFERILDEIVCDANTLQVERVCNPFGFGEGEVADGCVSADFIGDIRRHGVAGGGPGRRAIPATFERGSDNRLSGFVGLLHGPRKSTSRADGPGVYCTKSGV